MQIKKLKKVSLILPCKALAHKPSTLILSQEILTSVTLRKKMHMKKKKKGKLCTAVQSIGPQTKLYLLQRPLKFL